MFYTGDDLSDLVTCSKCENRMDDPRMLPCGNTLCNQDHSIPQDEFPRNESILRFLKKETTTFSSSSTKCIKEEK